MTRRIERGATAKPPFGNAAYAAVRSRGVNEPGAERERRHVRLVADAQRRGQPEHRSRAHLLLQHHGGAVVRLGERVPSVSASADSSRAFRGVHSSGPCGASDESPVRVETGEKPCESAAA